MLSKDTTIGSAEGKMCSEEKAKDVANLLVVPQKFAKVRVGSHGEGSLKRLGVELLDPLCHHSKSQE